MTTPFVAGRARRDTAGVALLSAYLDASSAGFASVVHRLPVLKCRSELLRAKTAAPLSHAVRRSLMIIFIDTIKRPQVAAILIT